MHGGGGNWRPRSLASGGEALRPSCSFWYYSSFESTFHCTVECTTEGPIVLSMSHDFLAVDVDEIIWFRETRLEREIEFSSFSPRDFLAPFILFFFTLHIQWRQEPFHRSCYHAGIVLDGWTFGAASLLEKRADYESRIITWSALEREARVLCKLLVEREFDTPAACAM